MRYAYDPDEIMENPGENPEGGLTSGENPENQPDGDARIKNAENPEIDPQNPFRNETEFVAYNSDYGEIVPQIRMKGCKIPLFPNRQEKRQIHRYENLVGGFLLGHLVLMNVLALITMMGFMWIQTTMDTVAAGGVLPVNYTLLLQEYFQNSSSYIALTMLCIAGCSVLVTWMGCRATRIPISNLFQTTDFHAGHALMYIAIALFIQTVTGYLSMGITELLEGVGITAFEPDLGLSTDIKTVLISFIYSVIVAPITEELLVRGFVMKNLSRVSQHFGIIMSALFFGVWHENIAQFVLAFCAGCFFGYITVKHNSLIPSIIAHMAVNFSAELFNICETYNWDYMVAAIDIVYTLLVIAGLVLLIRMFITERFPKTTPEQAERGGRLSLTSPLWMLVLFCHIGSAVYYILQESL